MPARTPFYRHRLFAVIDREPIGTVRLLPDANGANRIVAQQKTGIRRKGRESMIANPLVAGSSPARPVLGPIFRSSERESSLFTACSDGAVEQFGDLNMYYRHASTHRAGNTRAGAV
jgi:hypothetical protein